MSQWGTTQQQPDPEPPVACAEHGWLALGIAAGAGFAVAYAVDQVQPVDINHGAYIAAGVMVLAGVAGYLVRSEGRRVRRDITRHSAQRYQEGYDDGFVDGAASSSPARVSTINGRRQSARLTGDS